MIYIYNNVVVEELDYLVQDTWLLLRVSRFIGSNHQATARKTVTIRDIWKFENNTYWYKIFVEKYHHVFTVASQTHLSQSFCVTFRHPWQFWSYMWVITFRACDHVSFWTEYFSIENRFLMTVHLWENCNFVSEVWIFWQVYRFRSLLQLWNPICFK